ncbi:hypothetical protein B5G09_01900 [Alistipes sp. An54]|nr:hypothetical protein B5G09_01900 [Alistipes sp. An54]
MFETNASTDSAIRADYRFLRRIGWTKIEKIPRFQEFSANYFPAGPFSQPLPMERRRKADIGDHFPFSK